MKTTKYRIGDKVRVITPPTYSGEFSVIVGEIPKQGDICTVSGFVPTLFGEAVLLKECTILGKFDTAIQFGFLPHIFEPYVMEVEPLPDDMMKEAVELINLY